MKLTDIGSRPVHTVGPDDSIDRAIQVMEETHVRHLAVAQGDALVGILSERDLLGSVGGLRSEQRRVLRDGREVTLGPSQVSEVMTRHVLSLPIEADVGEAARFALKNHVGTIPLLKDQRLHAIVSRTDLLRALRDMSLAANEESSCYEPVRKHMTTRVFTVSPEADIAVVDRAFREKGFRHLPVLEEGKLVGMISERDVRRASGIETVLGEESRSRGEVMIGCRRVGDVMSPEPETIHPDKTLAEAAHLMLADRLGSLCVIENELLVGIITETDLLRILARSAE
ncbi:MAG: CBS domain-containing protein [Phycisphaerales bacterium]|nr:MAG: CBS domain-containing protein [Phycisphaerales bacterium]